MRSPCKKRSFIRIIIREIINGNIYVIPYSLIPVIFILKSHAIIFGMTGDKYLMSVLCHCQIYACCLRLGKDRKLGTCFKQFRRCIRMSGMRSQEYVIESSYKRNLPVQHSVLKHSEKLSGKLSFIDTVVMIKSRLCSPADMENAGNMGIRPVKYLNRLLPVIHLFERYIFNGGTGYDHSVEFLVFDLIERNIEFIQM